MHLDQLFAELEPQLVITQSVDGSTCFGGEHSFFQWLICRVGLFLLIYLLLSLLKVD